MLPGVLLPTSAPSRGALVTRATAQSIASGGSGTALSFSSALYDTGGFWSAGAPTRLTIPPPFAGRMCLLTALFDFATIGTGFVVSLIIRKNGTTALVDDARNPSTPNHVPMNSSLAVVVADADYFEVLAYQNSGGAVNASVTYFVPQFSIVAVG